MSIARHHAEWLSLVEVSGPFLSMPVLMRVFPQGLEAHDTELFRTLRIAYEEWEDNLESRRPDPTIHHAWMKFVLNQVLRLPDGVILEGQAIPQTLQTSIPEHGELLRPTLIVKNPDGGPHAGQPRLLIQVYPAGQDLDKPVTGKTWKISPGTRMMELLHATDVRLGLVTNGEHWMLVDAPRNETTGFASWYAHLWLEEQITLRAFIALLNVERFFNVPDGDTLEALLAESAANQQEVTDQLGYQVRRAVEVLIQSLDQADQDHGRQLLAEIPETVLYEAALTVMMRLVFLFCAEERGLLLLGDKLYDEFYAVSTLRAQLRETADQHGEEILERRHDAWCRLLAAFRAVHGGVKHDRLTLPTYSGHLFDPDRFPFLEGRKRSTSWRTTPATPLPVNNLTVLHLLEALQILQVKVPGGGPAEARRLSFRALDIEQIGHVYEGLLDHTAKRAKEPVLGLAGTREKEPEVPLSKLESFAASVPPGGCDFAENPKLLEFLKDETGRSESALKKALHRELDLEEANAFQAVCGSDTALWDRIKPFAGLVRFEATATARAYPVIVRAGSVYVTAGTDRRSSGTHYTPRSLTEPIVQYTLEPLVFVGPAEGKPKEKWKLRAPVELLNLKICDMACGSGAFLVQACRYLSERLLEAWETAEQEHPGVPGITPEGAAATGRVGEMLIPKDADERMIYARRIVAQRCLYGVDKNPLAAEMAKLSLWLLTLAKDKPFTFLDHAIRAGDSLVGISNIEQLETFSLDAKADVIPSLLDPIRNKIKLAQRYRTELEGMPSESVRDIEAKQLKNQEAEEQLVRLRFAADWLLAGEWGAPATQNTDESRRQALIDATLSFADEPVEVLRLEANTRLLQNNISSRFHWPLEFPEVLVDRGGFDAFVGNPPFVGGRRIRSTLGTQYLDYLTGALVPGGSANADLCAFFFRRAFSLLRPQGGFGLLATNTISQGDTCAVALEPILSGGGVIQRAVASRVWPGTANVFIAEVWVRRSEACGAAVLDDECVGQITASLRPRAEMTHKPYLLAANAEKSFQGSIVLGMGFVLSPDEARMLIDRNPKANQVLFPYLNGEDLNSHPQQQPSRWVINFFDWPLMRGATGCWRIADERQRKEWLRTGLVPEDYPDPVAADFPEPLQIIEEKVKPERTRRKPDGEYALRKPLPQRWWIYADKRPALYTAITKMNRILVRAQVSRTHAPVFYKPGIVFSMMVIVLALEEDGEFALIQSNLFESWLDTFSSSLKNDRRFTPSDSFENFPFPASCGAANEVGNAYYRHRQQLMLGRQEGLTNIYNRFHDPDDAVKDIQQLRDLHVELDKAVAAAYGWDDLKLGHDFHQTKQGLRFTICDPARREVLTRLLKLNHVRYAEEVAAGLHDKKKPKAPESKRGRKAKSPPPTGSLFEVDP